MAPIDTRKRRRLLIAVLSVVVVAATALLVGWALYPSDRSPKGAYYRIVTAVNRDDAEAVFPYLELEAQHAAFTIHHYERSSVERIRAAYPKERQAEELSRHLPLAEAKEGPGVFAVYAARFGWLGRLRKDLSGIERIEVEGERATVSTVRGTRYSFRRRDNGMWGLTLFTARLVADAEKAARDHSVIDAAAKDFENAEP